MSGVRALCQVSTSVVHDNYSLLWFGVIGFGIIEVANGLNGLDSLRNSSNSLVQQYHAGTCYWRLEDAQAYLRALSTFTFLVYWCARYSSLAAQTSNGQ